LAVGVREIADGGRQWSGGDAAALQVGLDTGAVRVLAAGDDLGDLCGAFREPLSRFVLQDWFDGGAAGFSNGLGAGSEQRTPALGVGLAAIAV